MAKFRVVYADGVEKTEEQSDCSTIEQFINCRFGSCDISGVTVELVAEEAPAKNPAKK